jgi:GNAT superfamily N-acetyltransferase
MNENELLIDILSTYIMMAIVDEIVPETSFFRDRYFPTGDTDIFAADKVLVEYRKGDRKMAAFVAPRAGDIPVDRRGYEIHEFEPPHILPSRVLTTDELRKRGFGEALLPSSTPAQRAVRLVLQDLTDLDNRIRRREEWMCAQTMILNACEMQEYIDADTEGDLLRVQYYDTVSDHEYTVADPWNSTSGDMFADVEAMCWSLSKSGLHAADLILGSQAASHVADMEKVGRLLDNRRMEFGNLAPRIENYAGIAHIGNLNFGGFQLNIFNVLHSYVDDDNTTKPFFPATSAMVTAPGCGRLMFGQITQIDFGNSDFTTHTGMRIPKLVVDQGKDTRKLRLGSRPLAAPRDYSPFRYAENVVR